MTISVGDKLPGATLLQMGAEGPEAVDLANKLKDRKVVIFGLPGAFTGACTTAHMPSFMRTREAFGAKGVEEVICIAVNDPFALKAWGESTGAEKAGITLLGDPSAALTKALGMDFSAPALGLINRSSRYAMVVDDGVVSVLNLEAEAGVCELTKGEELLAAM
ncbi:peroxiredoxin [Phaeovulum sp.]|uniref:peroxiredoxin n=1 Tax=Phaeovulum sp. TaxID=2934796 RepID=UPI0039E31A3D